MCASDSRTGIASTSFQTTFVMANNSDAICPLQVVATTEAKPHSMASMRCRNPLPQARALTAEADVRKDFVQVGSMINMPAGSLRSHQSLETRRNTATGRDLLPVRAAQSRVNGGKLSLGHRGSRGCTVGSGHTCDMSYDLRVI